MMRWLVKVDDTNWQPSPEQMELLLSLQCQREEMRIRALKNVNDSKRSLIGRMLLQKAACNALGKTSLKFGRTKEGKPYLQDHEAARRGLNLNVSHHGSWAVLAMEEKSLVGVDVSSTTPPRENLSFEAFFESMEESLTKKEWRSIRNAGATDEELFYAFFVFWVLKESYVKAVGIGLAVDTASVELIVPFEILCLRVQRQRQGVDASLVTRIHRDSQIKVVVNGRVARNWEFELYMIGQDHLMGVAVGPHEDATESYKKAMSELLDAEEDGMENNVPRRGSLLSMDSDSSSVGTYSKSSSFDSEYSVSDSFNEEEELLSGLRTMSVVDLLPQDLIEKYVQLAPA
mmetsp:Transcript_25121/g.51084  ORF Transcript_25121/g.51084 Transcript_25121/m.51084 type:complete len:345 (+) Transcript_25121:64-1098(+)|eukprot:CAMPEP_0181312312 /NCGR_PEP_ID=MMETSP1101-20121128/13627_1 /TAXON_ID=46948 /ORGANISM="Rhodomonas abbreviata, Strain Caron Lab Isolate" /LENGTH=344 /DNA_ID=CAMNT_0023419149 /DNA_START=55 /DNA_END=1089 /DNA_ORIENTATION=-